MPLLSPETTNQELTVDFIKLGHAVFRTVVEKPLDPIVALDKHISENDFVLPLITGQSPDQLSIEFGIAHSVDGRFEPTEDQLGYVEVLRGLGLLSTINGVSLISAQENPAPATIQPSVTASACNQDSDQLF